jgi:hypothetical protein
MPRAEVLLSQLLDDLRPGCGHVPQGLGLDAALELLDDLGGEPLRVEGKRLVEDHTRYLPMPGCGVFARGAFDHGAEGPRGALDGLDAAHVRDPAQAGLCQVG